MSLFCGVARDGLGVKMPYRGMELNTNFLEHDGYFFDEDSGGRYPPPDSRC